MIYALFTLFSVKNDLVRGGELHFNRLFVLLIGYALGSTILLNAKFSQFGLAFTVGLLVFCIAVIYLLDKKYADCHGSMYGSSYEEPMQEFVDKYGRFDDLNPIYTKEHREAARRKKNREARKFPRWTTLGAIAYFAAVIPLDIYFTVMVPEEADTLLRTAPLITADQLGHYVGGKKPVAIQGFTGASMVDGHQIVLERVYGYVRHYRSRGNTRCRWDESVWAPTGFVITSGKSKTKILVNSDDTNPAYLDVLFMGQGTELAHSPVPHNWFDDILKKVEHPKLKRFIVKGLPAHHAVTIIGTVDLASNYSYNNAQGVKYVLTALKYKGNSYDSVASTMPYAQLKKFLHDYSAVNPYLGNFPGEDTFYTQTAGKVHGAVPEAWLTSDDYRDYLEYY